MRKRRAAADCIPGAGAQHAHIRHLHREAVGRHSQQEMARQGDVRTTGGLEAGGRNPEDARALRHAQRRRAYRGFKTSWTGGVQRTLGNKAVLHRIGRTSPEEARQLESPRAGWKAVLVPRRLVLGRHARLARGNGRSVLGQIYKPGRHPRHTDIFEAARRRRVVGEICREVGHSPGHPDGARRDQRFAARPVDGKGDEDIRRRKRRTSFRL